MRNTTGYVAFISVLMSLVSVVSASELRPFTSDGCSAFPNGTIKQNNLWLHCCRAHDFDYWQGGTAKQRIDSDRRLRECVAKVGEPTVAALMLAGVRVGGTPYLPTSFRWGYGWPYPKGYGQLTESEFKQVHKQIVNSKFMTPGVVDIHK